MSGAPPHRRQRSRIDVATRVLAHRLLQRADRHPAAPDRKTAFRLVDERLVPSASGRRDVAERALRLALAAAAERVPGGSLEGELRANVRVGLRRRDGTARVTVVPSLFLGTGAGAASVVAMQASAADTADVRARRYRAAARILLRRRVRAFVVRPEGALQEVPASRSEPRGEAYPDRGCSPSGHPQSGRRRP